MKPSIPSADVLFGDSTPTEQKVTIPRLPGQLRTVEKASTRSEHQEKITVYVEPTELLALETAKLLIKGDYGIKADRGRIVREAIVMALAGLQAEGEESELVKRLKGMA